MRARIHQVVTFAAEPFRGNPAFVLTLDRPQPLPVLQAVCDQLREGVLAVLLPQSDEIGLQFVSPEGAHPGAGHATHAAAWVTFATLRPVARQVAFRLADGDRRVARRDGDRIEVDWPAMPARPVDRVAILGAALGAAPAESLEAPFGLVAVYRSAEEVATLRPDLDRVAALDCGTVVVTAPGTDFAIRVFAPKAGLPEDPVCGTAHRILMPLWGERLGRAELVSHQLSPRGGTLWCRQSGDVVSIAGAAMPFLEGTIDLPD